MALLCATHPDRDATHECTGCGAFHCETCLKALTTPGHTQPLQMCPVCGALERKFPAPVPTPEEGLRSAILRPFDEEGRLLILALSLPYWLTALPLLQVLFFGYLIYVGCLSAIYFQTVDHVGRGVPGLPFSANPASRWELFLSVLRGLICVIVGFGPMLISAIFFPGNWPFLMFFLIFGIMLTPAVILSIVVTGNAVNGLWPLAWWGIVARDIRAYGRLVGLFFLSSLAGILAVTLARYVIGWIPFLGTYLVGIVCTSAALIQASLVGQWLFEAGWTMDENDTAHG